MRLMCGHVISRDALNKLCNGNKWVLVVIIFTMIASYRNACQICNTVSIDNYSIVPEVAYYLGVSGWDKAIKVPLGNHFLNTSDSLILLTQYCESGFPKMGSTNSSSIGH